jgi:hypothetical protein
MAWDGRVIEIFLSSPGDVQPERELVRSVAQEWNQRRGRDTGCILSLLTWEDSVTSELEDYGQGSINSQIGDTYDVMIGLMWARFGTPTGKEESGTLEEFKRALGRKREGDPVRISFYFKMADLPFERVDASQLAKVQSFKKFLQEQGALTRDFRSADELRSQIALLFDQIAKDKERYTALTPAAGAAADEGREVLGDASAEEKVTVSAPAGPLEELGILDVTERLEKNVEEFTVEMADWAEQTKILGNAATTAVEELENLARFGNPPSSEVRKIIDRVTVRFEGNAKHAEERSGNITHLMREMLSLVEARVQLYSDFTVSGGQQAASLAELIEMASAIHMALGNTRGLVETIAQLPRMSSRFNAARRRVVEAYEPFLNELERASVAIGRAIAAMKKALPNDNSGDAELTNSVNANSSVPKKPSAQKPPSRRSPKGGRRQRKQQPKSGT